MDYKLKAAVHRSVAETLYVEDTHVNLPLVGAMLFYIRGPCPRKTWVWRLHVKGGCLLLNGDIFTVIINAF